MTAGGFDDISEECYYRFANMKATSNAETKIVMGLEPLKCLGLLLLSVQE
jgi:3-oxoacyl-(acyl-carrier-protein) synthase